MTKYIIFLLKLISVLVFLAIIAITCLLIFVNPNNYKADINNLVQKHTGRELKINGNIKWTLTPQIALSVQDIALSNVNNFGGQFLKINQADIKLSLIDLLKGKVVVKGISLQEPELFLTKAKTGKTNFDDLLAPKTSSHTETQGAQGAQGAQAVVSVKTISKTKFSPITINDLAIKNGKIQWQDALTGNNILVNSLNISAHDLNADLTKPLAPITVSGVIANLGKNNSEELGFSTTINADLSTQTFVLDPAQVKWAGITILAQLQAKVNQNLIKIDPLTIEVLGSKHQASISIDINEKTPILTIKDKTNTFEIGKLLSELAQFKKLHGDTNLTTALKASGTQLNSIKNSLQGPIDITIKQGSFAGVDIHKLLKQAEATLGSLFNSIKGKEQINIPALLTSQVKDWKTSQDANAKTNFDELQIKALFQNGISKATNFTVQHKDYYIQGAGEINLVNSTVNIEIKATYKGVDQSQNNDVAKYMLNTPLTIMVQGNLSAPTIKPVLSAYFKEAIEKIHKDLLKNIIKKTLNKVMQKDATDASPNPLDNLKQNLLDNLFNKKD